VTQRAGVANGHQVGAGACFLDMDADGDLDLYVANYVDFTYEKHRIRHFSGYPAYVGPNYYRPTPDTLLPQQFRRKHSPMSAPVRVWRPTRARDGYGLRRLR